MRSWAWTIALLLSLAGNGGRAQDSPSAENRVPAANYLAGKAAHGEGEFAEAAKRYRLAAEQGYAEAQFSLGSMYSEGEGVSRDNSEAEVWYLAAAKQDHEFAQLNLGLLYDTGYGGARAPALAAAWYFRAGFQGVASAQSNLGDLYRQGKGVRQDYVKAANWYRLAAIQGIPGAQYILGVMYEKGQGVPHNAVNAHVWYNLASSLGTENAAEARDRVAKSMSPSAITVAQNYANEWLEKNVGASAQQPVDKAGQPIEGKTDFLEDDFLRGLTEGSALGYAVGIQNPSLLRRLLSLGFSVGERQNNEESLLLRAVRSGHLEIVSMLLEAGADVNAADEFGMTPLVAAFGKQFVADKKLLELLLAAGADPSQGNASQGSPLLWAVQSGDLEIVKMLVDAGADVNAQDKFGMTPLLAAFDAQFGADRKLLDLLLAAGADVSQGNASRQSPLLWAVRSGDLEIVTLLVDAGADVNASDKFGVTPLLAAFDSQSGADRKLLDLLLAAGADASQGNASRQLPLLWAVQSGDLEIVTLLLDAGADVNASDKFGLTPLLAAFDNQYLVDKKLLDLLLAAGADISQGKASGLSPLLKALLIGDSAAIKLLIEYGANPNESYAIGSNELLMTPMKETIRDVLTSGGTPLMLTAAGGYMGATRVLIEFGANPGNSIQGKLGTHTVESLAQASGNSMLVKYLRTQR